MSRVSSLPAVTAVLVATWACAGGSSPGDMPGPAAEACAPSNAVLPSDATLVGMSGSYRIVAFASDGRSTEGSLELVDRPAGARSMSQASLPLHGTADIDFAAIGASVPVGLESEDPDRPGVLVVESEAASGPRVLVRFGSRMNDLIRPPFDGTETRLEPRQIGEEGFLGTWRSTGGGAAASGHFCAWID